ncbi:DUF6777 domain-containing protein [Streptomyces sp. NPDC058255]|uniref:DUF6777 domain-containing protein n=1 Tax=Streptomyces sp. NPDC058255 TaxID=3346407 RepID=UPI0036EBDFB4
MTFRVSMQRAGISAARRVALLLVSVLMVSAVSGCGKSDQLFAVRAVAAGISQANPFFKEDGGLGKDIHLPETRPSGGVQASNSPGLYGGTPGGAAQGGAPPGGTPDGSSGASPGASPGATSGASPGQDGTGGATGEFGGSTKPGTCVVAKLKKFLTAPENSAKAREWARVLHIGTDEIPYYIDHLTPAVLRNDTLVTNHEYKHGKAVPFGALLQAGIAILVDHQGLPAVKCSCGNPLLPSKTNIKKSSVQFKDGNKKWSGYRQDHIVIVEPPPGNPEIRRLQLVDVHDPGHGIDRRVGTAGEDDKSFDTHAGHAVPPVTGMTFAEASRNLADAGLGLAYDGDSLPPDDARVTASQPVEGSTLKWGAPVTLFVRPDDGSDQNRSTPPDTGGITTGPGDSGTGPDGSSTGPDGSSTGPDGSSTGPGQSSTGSGGTDSPPVSGSTPPDTGTGDSATPSESASTSVPASASESTSASVSTAPASTEVTPGSSGSSSVDPGVGDSVPGAPSSATDATDSGGLTGDTS